MSSLAQVQLAGSSVVTGVERSLAKGEEAGHCTAGVLFLPHGAVLFRVFTGFTDAAIFHQ